MRTTSPHARIDGPHGRTVISSFKRADILVNKAGIIRRADALDSTDEDWDDVIEVNLRSVFTLSRAFARALVNIASPALVPGRHPRPRLHRRQERPPRPHPRPRQRMAPKGINVNAIVPGYMATDNTQALRDDPTRSRDILSRIPAGRWGTPDDLQGAVVFLASDASSYVHGPTLTVDGGWLSR